MLSDRTLTTWALKYIRQCHYLRGAALMAVMFTASGCIFSGDSTVQPTAADAATTIDTSAINDPDPFRAISLRIHPLTHLDGMSGDAAQCTLLVHFELKDRFGDSVRDIGVLRVELHSPDRQAIAWDINQTITPEENVERFDPSTRTYRVLLNSPRWVYEEAAKKGALLTVRVVYTMPQAERALRDEYRLPTSQ